MTAPATIAVPHAGTCPHCRRRDGHVLGCWRLCLTCLAGTLTEIHVRLHTAERRSYSCGHTWRAPELLLLDDDRRGHAQERARQLDETCRIVAGDMRGDRADPSTITRRLIAGMQRGT